MGAFLGISLWVALATVVPGLVTLTTLYGACVFVAPRLVSGPAPEVNTWVWSGFAVTVMALTQAVGILLERFLVHKEWLGPEERELPIPKEIDDRGEAGVTFHPYAEYERLYILLAELRADEDAQGHLKRSIAQFFLSLNTLVALGAGIAAAAVLAAFSADPRTLPMAGMYAVALGAFLLVTFKVTVIRFEVMTHSLWAARMRRNSEAKAAAES